MSSLRCKAEWHDWNKYDEIVEAYGGLTQFRSCKRCNRIDYAKCYGNQAKADSVNSTIDKINNNAPFNPLDRSEHANN